MDASPSNQSVMMNITLPLILAVGLCACESGGPGPRAAVDLGKGTDMAVLEFFDASVSSDAPTRHDAVGTCTGSELPLIAQFGVFEREFTAVGSYSNPYLEMSAEVTLASPGGAQLKLPLFWDGGTSWRLRFSPAEVGDWSYTLSAADEGLDGQEGGFCVEAAGLRGGLVAAEYGFAHQDGTPAWLLGDTNWAFPVDITEEHHDRVALEAYLSRRASQGFNYLQVSLTFEQQLTATKSTWWPNDGGLAFTVAEGGVAAQQLNPAYFREVDTRVAAANELGITVALFFAWHRVWDRFPDESARLRFARYVVARYAAYDVVLIIGGEIKVAKAVSVADFDRIGQAVHEADPHGRLTGAHPGWEDYNIGVDPHIPAALEEEFAGGEWFDFGDYMQRNYFKVRGMAAEALPHDGIYQNLHEAALRARDHGKPVINAEYAYFKRDQDGDGAWDKFSGNNRQGFRLAAWSIYMAGAWPVVGFGSTYKGGLSDQANDDSTGLFDPAAVRNVDAESDLTHIAEFFRGIDWERLTPSDGLASGTGGNKYCLAELGRTYVVFSTGGTSTRLAPRVDSSAVFSVVRFDPRTGDRVTLQEYTGEGTIELATPSDGQDYAFLIETSAAASRTDLVLYDPLQGVSSGARLGGVLSATGWQVTSSTDQISWELPYGLTGPGAVEVEVSNWNPDAQVGSVEKSNFLAIYSGDHGDQSQANGDGQSYAYWRTGSNYVPDQAKVVAAPDGNVPFDTRIEKTTSNIPASWSAAQTYLFRIEWDAREIRFVIDGTVREQLPFGSVAPYLIRHVFLGSDNSAAGGLAISGPRYSNLRVFDLAP